MLLLALISYKNFSYLGKEEEFTLTAGQYTIHCYGAQGGSSFKGGNYGARGGYGAHVYGTLTVYGSGTKFYANVGGKGSSDKVGPSPGGFNGGGSSGKDTGGSIWGGKNDGSGGGGGSTDIRILNNEIESRIIVAAGGSGAVYGQNGADGGDEVGRWISMKWEVKPSDDTTQTKGNELLYGGNGGSSDFIPGSGAGGGYMGGHGREGSTKGIHYNAVSDGGSSFISGYRSCKTVNSIVFENANMIVGEENTEDGHIEIFYDFVCSKNCYSCKANETCDVCVEGFSLYNNQCLSECPPGTVSLNQVCVNCESPCGTCSQSTTHCDSCLDNLNLYNNGCVSDCPLGTVAVNFVCEKCQDPCETCSGEPGRCKSCKNGFYLYDNKCYADCSELNNEANDDYFGKDNNQNLCQKCSKDHCISCSADYSICEKCSETFYLDEATNECIIRPTQTPMASPSKSPLATPQETPTATPIATPIATPQETPIATPVASPKQTSLPTDESGTIIVYPPQCSKDGRYEKIVDYNKQVLVQIKVSNFTGITYETDGGAIHVVNGGLQCEKIFFKDCKSFSGAGGAIFLDNTYQFDNEITLDHLDFTQCEASYGGAVYIYASAAANIVSIKYCTFTENIATASKSTDHKFGGAAIFLTARKAKLYRNKYVRNNGPGGSLKFCNSFDRDGENNEVRMMKNEQQSVVISECSFEIKEGSDCSLFYLPGKKGSSVELNNCEFTGSLSSGSHYIDGKSGSSDCSKLVVKNCKFAENEKKSFNFDSGKNFLLVDLNEQTFNFKSSSNKINIKKNFGSMKVILAVAVPAVALFILFIVMVTIKKTSPKVLDESLVSNEVLDLF
ncbi:hypothetical protein M9Y10_035604 [Tritrichomonas musculus]|uniref:receptor protein-tyrosine kinase n=1 Tax=Tritrichomonas musculus TaxID=1915356 RepID=A0ABR2GX07_9EUKA